MPPVVAAGVRRGAHVILRDMRSRTHRLKRGATASVATRGAAALLAFALAAAGAARRLRRRGASAVRVVRDALQGDARAALPGGVVPLTVTEDDTTGFDGAHDEERRVAGASSHLWPHGRQLRPRDRESAAHARGHVERAHVRDAGHRRRAVDAARPPSTSPASWPSDACRHEATRQHEMQHVAAYRALLDEAAVQLRADLPAAVAASWTGPSATDVRTRFDDALRDLHARVHARAARAARGAPGADRHTRGIRARRPRLPRLLTGDRSGRSWKIRARRHVHLADRCAPDLPIVLQQRPRRAPRAHRGLRLARAMQVHRLARRQQRSRIDQPATQEDSR